MKTIILCISILFGLVGCSSVKMGNQNLSSEYISLNVPLESEHGQIILSCLQYWSDNYMGNESGLRFIPCSPQQIEKIQGLFNHKLVPGNKADVQPESRNGRLYILHVLNRDTREGGIAVAVRGVSVATNEQATVLLETMYHFGPNGSIFKLLKTNGIWQVGSYSNLYASDYSR